MEFINENFAVPNSSRKIEPNWNCVWLGLVDVRIHILLSFIQSELHRDLYLEELAHLVNLSPSRLRHLFKRDTGQTLTQYLVSQRLNQARVLLETTHLSVKEIMNRVGISDSSHFARDFKKLFGLTPTTYRQQRALCLMEHSTQYWLATSTKNPGPSAKVPI